MLSDVVDELDDNVNDDLSELNDEHAALTEFEEQKTLEGRV